MDAQELALVWPQHPHNGGSRKGRQDIQQQSKIIISNVYKFFKTIADNPKIREKIKFSQAMKLTAQACGVSEKTVQRIKRTLETVGGDAEEDFERPRKRYKRESKKTQLDAFDNQVVRATVLQYYENGEFPTSKQLKIDLEKKIDYAGSEESVNRLLKSLGFKFKKGSHGRRVLMEQRNIVTSRAIFLQKMHLLKINDTRPIVYLDSTLVLQKYAKTHVWQDSDDGVGLKVPIEKGCRIIITRAAFAIPGSAPDKNVMFYTENKSQDCDNSETNLSLFKEWFVNHILCRLEEGSIIVMDDMSYHSALEDKIPNSKWEKNDIIQWLLSNNIPHDPSVSKSELLSVKEIQRVEKSYDLDHITNEMGHEIVRLPPYHCQYNPINLVWAQMKREVASRNTTLRMADMEKLIDETLSNVTTENWEKFVKYAEDLQEADFQKQCYKADIIESNMIHLDDSTDNSDESDFEMY